MEPVKTDVREGCGGNSRVFSTALLLLALAGLITGVLLTFAPVVRGDFAILDDGYNIFLNPEMGPVSSERLAKFFTDLTSARRYMPVGWLGLSLVFGCQGMEPAGYHIASLTWHTLAAVFLFLTAYNFFGQCVVPNERLRRILAALLVAAAWGMHPLRAEAVSWASGMLHTQTCAFAFMAVWFWTLRWSIPARAGWCAAGACLALAMSLLTYPLALGAAGVCWLLDHAVRLPVLPDGRRSSRLVRWRLSGGIMIMSAIVVGAFVTTMIARGASGDTFSAMPSVTDFGLFERGLQAFYMWGHYFAFLVFPFEAAPIYTTLYSLKPAEPDVYLMAGLSLAGLLGALWLARRKREILGWLAAYSAMALPVMGLTEHPWIPHDRYASLLHPVLLLWIGSVLLKHGGDRLLRVAACLVAALIFAGALYAHGLTKVWTTPANFTARLEQVLPRNAWAGHYLGKVPASDLFLKGRFDEIDPVLDRAETMSPGWSAGPVRAEYVELVKKHREFLNSIWPGRWLSPLTVWYFETGKSFEEKKDWATAAAHFQAALRQDEFFVEARQEQAWCELEMNRPGEARASMERAISQANVRSGPREQSFWRLLAAVHRARGEIQLEAATLDRAQQRQFPKASN